MKNYRFYLGFFTVLAICSLINITTEIAPEQRIQFLLDTSYVVITFSGLSLVVGIILALGEPKGFMPPTNKVFEVGYVKMIIEGDEKKLVILLESGKDTTTYELPITVFRRTENFSELVNKDIKNIYGTIEEVQS